MQRLVAIGFLVFMVGCLSPIDFPVQRRGNQVVISGSLSNVSEDPGRENLITIGITSGTGTRPEPVEDAQITLLEDGRVLSTYINVGGGRYQLPIFVKPEPGRAYVAEVRLADGRVYQSKQETLPTVNATSTASGRFVFDENVAFSGNVVRTAFYTIDADVATNAPNSFFRIYTRETWFLEPTNFPDPFNSVPPPCFVPGAVDPQRINLINTAGRTNVEPIRLEIASRRVDPAFLKRIYFTVYTATLTPTAYEYWRKVNILANQVGSIFDVPPAEISGNWQNVAEPNEKVWGFFQVANTTAFRFFVVGSEVPFFLGTYCEYNSNVPPDSYPNECLNCLSLPGSSYQRPVWWPGG